MFQCAGHGSSGARSTGTGRFTCIPPRPWHRTSWANGERCWTAANGGISNGDAATYDGDTPQAARARIRKHGRVLLTNPDMLHVGILPNHPLWAGFFRHLKFVVIDEAHSYRGVFGSQVACVLRRLRRVCAQYGNSPQFIATSATIANPGEHFELLTGLPGHGD